MKTIVVQIGNSDNKLPQSLWADFVQAVDKVVQIHAHHRHFFGGSSNWLRWQNVAWVFECEDENIQPLQAELITERGRYGQDSVAYMQGETMFL